MSFDASRRTQSCPDEALRSLSAFRAYCSSRGEDFKKPDMHIKLSTAQELKADLEGTNASACASSRSKIRECSGSKNSHLEPGDTPRDRGVDGTMTGARYASARTQQLPAPFPDEDDEDAFDVPWAVAYLGALITSAAIIL